MTIEKDSLPKLLGEVIFYRNGVLTIVKQYFEGYHEGLGIYHKGWRGPETVRFKQIIRPSVIYKVAPVEPLTPIEKV